MRNWIIAIAGVAAGLVAGADAELGLVGAAEPGRAQVAEYGKTPEGTPIEQYTLTNGRVTAKVITYGAILTDLLAPDRDGKAGDVVLGFDSLEGYLTRHPYFGSTVGRVGNRIAKGKFTLDGKEYSLAVNNGPNALHGGIKGFDKVVWKVEAADGRSIKLAYLSKDGEEGFPGDLAVTVTYSVTDDDALKIDYSATASGKATPINLTNHTYFNLSGPASGSILKHEIMLNADKYTPVDDTLIPTGEIAPVAGTPLDFTAPTPIGSRIEQMKGDPTGYDHNIVLRGSADGKPALAARVYDPASGRQMEAYTTEPGVQFYTGNFLDGSVKGKGGVAYQQRQGFCLETQHFPDSVHHSNFPDTILKPGQTYTSTTLYKFSAH